MLVWAVALGMLLLVVWRVIEAAFGHREQEGADAAPASGWRRRLKAVIYAALGVTALQVAIGSGSSSSGRAREG